MKLPLGAGGHCRLEGAGCSLQGGVDSLRSSLCVKKVRGLRECSALRELQAPRVCVCVCVCVCV